METPIRIEFRKRRDFSTKVNVTFTFVRENARSFLKSMILIAGPPVLIASMLLSSFVGEFLRLATDISNNPEGIENYFKSLNFWLQTSAMLVFLLISYVVVIATSYNYMLLYDERKSNAIEVHEVWARVRETIGMYLGTSILMMLIFLAAYIVCVIPIVMLSTGSIGLAVLFGIAVIVGAIYFAVAVSLIFPVRAFEGKGFFESIGRSIYLVKGKWWSTFGLSFVLSLLVGVISYLFSIPSAILQAVAMAHSIDPVNSARPEGALGSAIFILNSLAYLTQLLLYFLPMIGLAFQFFNLVEMKESKGLMDQIGGLGQQDGKNDRKESY